MKNLMFFALSCLLVVLMPGADALAQGCSMCKAVAANHDGSADGVGFLNNGIIYLMSVPYVLVGVIAFLWFRNSKKQRDNKDQLSKRIREATKNV